MADGPLQSLLNLQVTFDSNGNLIVYSKTGGNTGPAQAVSKSRARTEAGNQLVVVFK